MPNIETLVSDIHDVIQGKKTKEASSVAPLRYEKHVEDLLPTESPKDREHKPFALHASKIGKNCLRQMWYAQWMPNEAEPLLPHTLIKFTYGDLVEELALDMVRGSGHAISHEQERIEFPAPNGFTVSGRLDCVVDGYVVDVKSTSPYSFNDWAFKPLTADNDSFGYRWQLHTYGYAALQGQLDADPTRGYLLLLDKQNGHIALSWTDYDFSAYERRLQIITSSIASKDTLPPRAFDATEKDRLGNNKLCTECGYCDYKKKCWEENDITGTVRSGKVVWLVAGEGRKKVALKPGEIKL